VDDGTEIRRIDLDDIEDGDMVAVIVEEPDRPGGFRIAGYCDGRAVPETVEQAKYGLRQLRTACVCGDVDLRYVGYSHKMPDAHPWPTLIYQCRACQRKLSFMRLTAADARRAMIGGYGTSP